MVSLFDIAFIFAVGAFIGWTIEFIFRSIKYRRWINPGPLTGPYLLMWGSAFVFFYFVSALSIPFFVKVILFGVSTTSMELISGLILLKYYSIRLWDYSNDWMNYKGVIAPLFSFIWTALGVLFYFTTVPVIIKVLVIVKGVPSIYFLLGLFYGIFSVDMIITYNILTKIKKVAKDLSSINMQKITVNYVFFKNNIGSRIEEMKRQRFLRRFFFSAFLRNKEMLKQIKEFVGLKK